jgi:DNA replication protein DnaC
MLDAKSIERWTDGSCPSCKRQAAVSRLTQGAEIPERHRDCEFSNYATDDHPGQTVALRTCREYAENFAVHLNVGRCLLLLGEKGNGKNHLATAIAKHLLIEGYSVLRIKAAEFLDEYWDKSFGERKPWIKALAQVDLVLLDEVGRHSVKDAAHNALFALIDARSEAVKPTLLMSNKPKEVVEEIVTPEGYDRLCENSGILVRFCWRSYRRSSGRAAA